MSALVSVKDYEEEASKYLSRSALGYYNSGSISEVTLNENKEAFHRWYIRPKFLIDVSKRDLTTTILGHKVSVPFGVAPAAMQKLAHPDGEVANAKAVARMGTVFTLSTVSTSSIEEVATATPKCLKFFQLYIYKDRDITAKLVVRAEKAGFRALVLTVDAPFLGIRYADQRNKFALPPHLRLANFDEGDEKANAASKSKGGSGISEYVASLFDPALTWKDVTWLKSITSLPIVLKGVLTAEVALQGLKVGADAIWVSNHGGRQLDGVSPTIEALIEVVDAVKGRCEIYVDGGFRTGPDIFKALALGACMVFTGRPLLWGLACDGEEGAFKVLQILKNELDNTMALSGCTSISQITRAMVKRSGSCSKI